VREGANSRWEHRGRISDRSSRAFNPLSSLARCRATLQSSCCRRAFTERAPLTYPRPDGTISRSILTLTAPRSRSRQSLRPDQRDDVPNAAWFTDGKRQSQHRRCAAPASAQIRSSSHAYLSSDSRRADQDHQQIAPRRQNYPGISRQNHLAIDPCDRVALSPTPTHRRRAAFTALRLALE